MRFTQLVDSVKKPRTTMKFLQQPKNPNPNGPTVPHNGFMAIAFCLSLFSFRLGYGRVLSFKLGKFKIVVAGTAAAVKEVLVTRSGDYAGRPQTYFFVALTLGEAPVPHGCTLLRIEFLIFIVVAYKSNRDRPYY